MFFARQAILDADLRTFGYELLFRGAGEESAGEDNIRSAFEALGGEQALGARRAFVQFSRDLLVSSRPLPLPRQAAVIQVRESIEPDAEVVQSCQRLQRAGYLIALDDFTQGPAWRFLGHLADFVKVDFRRTTFPQRGAIAREYGRRGKQLVAKGVETRQQLQQARAMGYAYFQGSFLSKPALAAATDIPPFRRARLQLLAQLQRPEVEFDQLAEAIRSDAAYAEHLLSYVNANASARKAPIGNLQQALLVLGEEELRTWLTVALVPEIAAGQPPELATLSLARARFCASAAKLTGAADRARQFTLLGLFSLLEAIAGRPLEELLDALNLSPEIRAALVRRSPDGDPAAACLRLAQACEEADWERAAEAEAALGISAADSGRLYCESFRWAETMLAPAEPPDPKR